MNRFRLFSLTLLMLALPLLAQEPHTGTHKVDTLDNPDLLWLKKGGIVIGFSPDGQSFVCQGDGLVQIRRTSDGELLNSFPTIVVGSYYPDLSTDGSLVAIGSANNSIAILDTHTGELAQMIEPQDNGPDGIKGVAFSPDGLTLASIDLQGQNSKVRLWDVHTGKMIRQYGVVDGGYTIACSPDGKYVAVGNHGGYIHVWDRLTGESAGGGKTGGIISRVRFSPDGKYLASCDDNYEITIWRTADWSKAHTWKGHSSEINDLRFTPGSQFLVSAGNDGLREWNIETGEQVYYYTIIYKGLPVGFDNAIITPDSSYIISSVGKSLYKWQAHWSPASVVPEQNDPAAIGMRIAPNPVSASALLEFTVPDGLPALISIDITDLQGRKLIELPQQRMQPGIQQIPLNIASLLNGTYFCHLSMNNHSYSLHFLIQH